MSIRTDYVPGVCNIGVDEIRRRQRSGYLAAGFTLLLFAGLLWSGAGPAWFVILFLPAAAAAISLIQAAFRFCVYFGLAALFNFGPEGERHEVTSNLARETDRSKSYRLIAYSVAAAAAFTIVAVLIAMAVRW